MGRKAQLTNSVTHTYFWVLLGILTSKVGQTDLVFGMRSGFILCASDITSLWWIQQLRFVPRWLTSSLQTHIHTHAHTHTHRQHFDQLI